MSLTGLDLDSGKQTTTTSAVEPVGLPPHTSTLYKGLEQILGQRIVAAQIPSKNLHALSNNMNSYCFIYA